MTSGGYVGLSIATLLSQHHKVMAVDIVPEKVELINSKKSPIQDEYIEKYLAEKELDLTATLDAKEAYSDADFVVIAAPTIRTKVKRLKPDTIVSFEYHMNMKVLSQRSYPSDGILSVYDLILIPKWVMEEIEDSTYRSTYVEQLQAQGYPIRWIDETKYGAFVNDEDVNLYYIVEAAVSRVSELMRFLRRKVKTEDLIDLPSAEEWMPAACTVKF